MPALRHRDGRRMITPVPLAAPGRLGVEEGGRIREAIRRVVDDGVWIGGPEVEAFEAEFADYLGGVEVVGCGNGTDALVLAMLALALPSGSSVLIAANEGGYAATATRLAGLIPVPIDVDPVTMAPTPATAEAMRDGTTSALVVTHLHGDPVALSELDHWRRRHGLALVEDCAQAHGARPGGRHVGTIGDVAAFSFYPTKNLGALGDGGAVTTGDPVLAGRARRLAQYGWDPRPRIALPGGRNSRLDAIQAAVLRVRLGFLDSANTRRRAILAGYRATCPSLDLAGDAVAGVAHHAVLRSGHRADLVTHLDRAGVSTGIHYPLVLGQMPGLAIRSGAETTPVAAELAGRILSIPCAAELTDDEVERVTDALVAWETR